MGNQASSTTLAPQTGASNAQFSDGCPVMHTKAVPPSQVDGCPVMHKKSQPPESDQSGGCPVKYKNKKQFNVYSQEINPDNMMPTNPNQLPGPDQTKPIDTTRVKSTIPKGGSDATWTYPSPQMFYNSLKVMMIGNPYSCRLTIRICREKGKAVTSLRMMLMQLSQCTTT